ncbi:MAG: DUF4433 domain-containing protein [Selenomonadaceae bacterium]|nr:DUF4433 domain-containing protein [Selenomonadaceae bacterium]
MITQIKRNIALRATERGIKYLIHFTQTENLPCIQTYGLRARQDLENSQIFFHFNDVQRFDGFPNAISLSVTFPNYKMFYSLRQRDKSTQWAIILLDAYELLSNCDCAFHATNAANNRMRFTPLENRMTLAAFESMFYDDELRKARSLEDNEPTDPQAEILCFNPIPTKFFKDIAFDGEMFSYRHDWSYWEKNR